MPPNTITFEMTDTLITQAAREYCGTFARNTFTPSNLAVAFACVAIVAFTPDTDGTWQWLRWLAATAPAIYGLLFAGWLVGLWWLPRLAQRRIAHQPHRNVTIAFAEPGLTLQSATERLEVRWTELLEARELPNFWLLCFRAGFKVPVPKATLAQALVDEIRARAPPKR